MDIYKADIEFNELWWNPFQLTSVVLSRGQLEEVPWADVHSSALTDRLVLRVQHGTSSKPPTEEKYYFYC